jgi:glycopeptide antibiotics resistance protein
MSSTNTGSRLAIALLAYMLAVTLIVTLLPFRFRAPQQWHMLATGDLRDLFANVLLFVPLGFLYRAARPSRRKGITLSVLFIGAAVSAMIETAQLFVSARDASVLDIASNALGAWLGALAFDRIARFGTDGRLLGWLALELPIMGLIYLLVPLLWVGSLAAGRELPRLAALLLLGVFGAILLGGVQRHYVSRSRAAVPAAATAFAAAWFVAGTFPLLRSRPLYVLIGAAVVAASCWAMMRNAARLELPDRRFEVPLLKTAAPFYALYLALIMAAPLTGDIVSWRLWLGFPGIASHQSEIVRLLELVAAFTLLGYMVAEFRGRTISYFRSALPRVLGWAVTLTAVTETLRGFQWRGGASVARGLVLAVAAVYGGWLYYLQRAHAMKLLSQGSNGRTMR